MSVLVAYTPDEFGRAALDHGEAEALRRDVPLVVVNGTKGSSLVDQRYAGDEEMEQVRARLEADGVEVTIRRDVTPDVAQLVLEIAAETHTDLIVVGIRHRSPVGKALMGSVSQRLLLDARCPVLAVKPGA